MGDAHSDLAGESRARDYWAVFQDVLGAHEWTLAKLMVLQCNNILYVKCKQSPARIQRQLEIIVKFEHEDYWARIRGTGTEKDHAH